jgi:hypothetical protein
MQVSLTRQPGQTLYAYPDGYSLADWITHRVQLVEQSAPNLGRYQATLDESKSTLWRFFEGAGQPTNWSESKGYFQLDSDGAAIILPVLSSIDRRAIDGVIELFVGEVQPVTINVFDANHNPVNIESLNLLLRIENTDRSFVVEYTQAQLTVAENAVSFIPSIALTEKAAKYRFGLRSLPNKTRLASGSVDVRYAP